MTSSALGMALTLGACGRIGFSTNAGIDSSLTADGGFTPPTCGAGCATDEFCASPIGSCAGVPSCASSPTSCPATSDPVCGCDRLSYLNACEANRSGVSVASTGDCPALGNPICTPACNMDELCSTPVGVCNAQPGTCEPIPPADSCDFQPIVCGCDLNVYTNFCTAGAAGVSVLERGGCSM